MSERTLGRLGRQLAACVSLTMAMSALASAQSAADYRKQLDELEPAWRSAGEAVKAAEQARKVTARAVTIERAPLTVVADSIIAQHVIPGVELAARQIEETFGASARILRDHPVVIRHRVVTNNGDTTHLIGVRGSGREQVIQLDDPDATRAHLATTLSGTVVVGVLHTALDDSLRHWFHTAFPAGVPPRSELGRAYVDLVTASSTISRRCLEGDLLGCRQLLGITPSMNLVVDGLTAAQRRMLVSTNGRRLRSPGKAAEFDRCTREDDDAACTARLVELSTDYLFRVTSSVDVRRSFARSVLAQGGPGAYARLQASDSLPLGDRFALAGAAPLDSLVATWRSSVLQVPPSPSSVTPAAAFATLAWIIACGSLALRSSRWR